MSHQTFNIGVVLKLTGIVTDVFLVPPKAVSSFTVAFGIVKVVVGIVELVQSLISEFQRPW